MNATPAPWQHSRKDGNFTLYHEHPGNGCTVRQTVLLVRDRGVIPSESDARLLDAAPELAEALRGLLTAAASYGGENPWHDELEAAKSNARAVLAKLEVAP